jgi:hypothetical protein
VLTRERSGVYSSQWTREASNPAAIAYDDVFKFIGHGTHNYTALWTPYLLNLSFNLSVLYGEIGRGSKARANDRKFAMTSIMPLSD